MRRRWRVIGMVALTSIFVLAATVGLAAASRDDQNGGAPALPTPARVAPTPDPLVERRTELTGQIQDAALIHAWLSNEIQKLGRERDALVREVNALKTAKDILLEGVERAP